MWYKASMHFSRFFTISSVFIVLNLIFPHTSVFAQPKAAEVADRECDKKLSNQLEHAWKETQKGIQILNDDIIQKDYAIDAYATTSLANEFGFYFGGPGGAKSFTLEQCIAAELRGIKESRGLSNSSEDIKSFILQLHKQTSESKAIGFVDLQNQLDDGTYDIVIKDSLAGDSFKLFLLDELDKAHPGFIAALLPILSDRELPLFDKLKKVELLGGGATSNKNISKFLSVFDYTRDRPTGEAINDRHLIKVVVSHLFSDTTYAVFLRQLKERQAKQKLEGIPRELPVTYYHQLAKLIDKVELPDDVLYRYSILVHEIDNALTTQSEERKKDILIKNRTKDEEITKASEFSNRTNPKLLKALKAQYLLQQLKQGVEFKNISFVMKDGDLVLAAKTMIYQGLGNVRHRTYALKTMIRIDNFEIEKDLRVNPWTGEVFYDGIDQLSDTAHELNDALIASMVDGKPNYVHSRYKLSGAAIEEINKIIKEHKNDRLSYEEDGLLAQLMGRSDLTDDARRDAETLRMDRQVFLAALDTALSATLDVGKALKLATAKIKENENRLRDLLNEQHRVVSLYMGKPDTEENKKELQTAFAWHQTQEFYERLRVKFPGLDYVIQAFFMGAEAQKHIFMYSRPGAAKTFLSKVLLQAQVFNVNAGRENLADALKRTFFLQMHKMQNEGVIIGHQKLNKLLKDRSVEYELRNSLIHPDVYNALVDEAEKGPPHVLNTLLGILEENVSRQGNEQMKGSLRLAVLTSNKTPAEMVQSVPEKDKADMQALLARTPNVVYLTNKFSTPEETFLYLKGVKERNGKKPLEIVQELPRMQIEQIRPLTQKVQFATAVEDLAFDVLKSFHSKRLDRQKELDRKHKEEPTMHPYTDYPTSMPSDRNNDKYVDQLKSAFIIHQLVSGVPYDQINYTIEHRDLWMLVYGPTTWSDWSIEITEKDGAVYFEPKIGAGLDTNQMNIDGREKFNRKMVAESLTDFVNALNSRVHSIILNHRQRIDQFPSLFPTLVVDIDKLKSWIEKQPSNP